MPREEKGSPMGSYDDAPGGSGTEGGGGSSLAARRARLRGSLSRTGTAYPNDEGNYETPTVEGVTEDAQPEEVEEPAPAPAPVSVPVQTQPKTRKSAQFDPASATGAGQPSAQTASAVDDALQAPQTDNHVKPDGMPAAKSIPSPSMQPQSQPAVSNLSNDQVSQYITSSLFDAAQSTAPHPTSSSAPLSPLPTIPDQAVEALQNIDGVLNACATNLAALQRLSEEQTDVLKGLTTSLQNQTLFEIGLNLNSLTESLSAALEPMKAIGELVPAMDQLVATLEAREADAPTVEKLSPDQLITSLADQLSAGLIDPWTFKCAYMAIYPSEHPADLLHRLVELLGTQRLSGDLFRSAYEAVQGAEPPSGSRSSRRPISMDRDSPDYESNLTEDIREQIEDLQRANEDLVRRQEERERELSQVLIQKEQELQEAQELLNSRYDEFNSRYDEVADMLNKREEEYRALLESKDMELVEKESELNLLRAQMEELRNQTEEMVQELQKQLADVKSAKDELAKNASNSTFFDPAPRGGADSKQSGAYLEQPPASPAPSQTTSQGMQAVQPAPSQTSSQQMQAMQPPGAPSTNAGQPQPAANAANRANTTQQQQAATPFSSGGGSSGSYGSGVRAQVFEVIVRQALAGAPWREICAGPMQVNNISPDEVESEVKRRQAFLNK
jgi:hypothetical protein